MQRIVTLSLMLLLLAAPAFAEDQPAAREKPQAQAADEAKAEAEKPADDEKQPAVEVVFVLDTTGSMSGLINAAKEKVWAIANTLATAKPAPTIKMGLVGYRDRGDQYVTKITELTDDLDAVYKDLMGFQAGGGGDGPESVNQALHEAVTKIAWSEDETTYRVIFLVGDAPPHMDYENDVRYPATCEQAAKAGIVVNTIQCGSQPATTPVWTKIAQLAEGKYFRVEQSGGAILASTPFDEQLAKLSSELGDTRVFYGEKNARRDAMRKLDALKEADEKATDAAKARKAEFFAKPAGEAAFRGGAGGFAAGASELVDDVAAGRVDLDKIEAQQLPEELRKMGKDQRESYLKKQAEKRKELQKKIAELSEKRQKYIREQLEKQNKDKPTLDDVIFESIKTQGAKRGLKYEGGPKY